MQSWVRKQAQVSIKEGWEKEEKGTNSDSSVNGLIGGEEKNSLGELGRKPMKKMRLTLDREW